MPGKKNKGKGAAKVAPIPSATAQWEAVDRWVSYLQDMSHGEGDSIDAAAYELESAWQRIGYGSDGRPMVKRGEMLSDNPLSALFFLLDFGIYPPPELLLTLRDTWRVYLEGAGLISLEEAFLGKPRKSAGNYAKQRSSELRKHSIRGALLILIRNGHKPMDAAQKISDELGGKPDADSILRMCRRHDTWEMIPPPLGEN